MALANQRNVAMVACIAVIMNITAAKLQLPREPGETLAAAEAVAAVLTRMRQPQCSVILLINGAASTPAVAKSLQHLASPWGATVLEAREATEGPNRTLELLDTVLHRARKVSRLSWCVSVVVVSDDPSFLFSCTKQAHESGLLVWSTRLVALTSLPLPRLHQLESVLSQTNSAVITCDGDTPPRCKVFVHLPYSQHVVQVARWSRASLTLTSALPLFPEKFHRFMERPCLRLTAEEFPPHVVLQHTMTANGGPRLIFSGAMMRVLGALAQSLNFSYTVVRSPDSSFGTRLANGTETGMVGMVARQEVDLGLGPFGINEERSMIIDYTAPIMNDYMRILAGRGRAEVNPWGFLLPLAPLVWAGLLGSFVLLLVITVLLVYSTSFGAPTLSPYVRVLLQEESRFPALRGWERLLLGSWMLAMTVVTQSYTGNLMSLLAVRYVPQPLQTLRALLDATATTMIWEYNTVYVNHFRTSQDGILREVRESEAVGRIQFVLATEYPDMLQRLVRPGTHAFVGEDLTLRVLISQQFSETGNCDFYKSRESFMSFLYCMIGQKHSPLVISVSTRITWITEAGLYKHWMDSLSSNSTACQRLPAKITVRSSLSFSNLWGIFAVFGVGNALGLLMLFLEVLPGSKLHHFLAASITSK